MIFNMVSVGLYAIFCIGTKKAGSVPPIIPIIGEIAFHGVAATVFTGWNSGFMLYVICIVPLVFYWPTVKRKQATALAFIFTFTFLATKLYCCFFSAHSVGYTDKRIASALSFQLYVLLLYVDLFFYPFQENYRQ